MAQTASQICNTSRNIAGCPGYTAISGQALNEVLADICESYDFDYARGIASFNFNISLTGGPAVAGGGPYPLPTDWLRADFGDVFFMDQGVPHRLVSVDQYQWDMMVQQAGLQSYPTIYTTFLEGYPAGAGGPPVMFVYTPPQSNYPVTARYRRQMPDITAPETSSTTPWFPYTQYLVEATAAKLFRTTDDARFEQFERTRLATMSRILKMANDNSGRAKTVKLDQRRFGIDYQDLPLTKQVWI